MGRITRHYCNVTLQLSLQYILAISSSHYCRTMSSRTYTQYSSSLLHFFRLNSFDYFCLSSQSLQWVNHPWSLSSRAWRDSRWRMSLSGVLRAYSGTLCGFRAGEAAYKISCTNKSPANPHIVRSLESKEFTYSHIIFSGVAKLVGHRLAASWVLARLTLLVFVEVFVFIDLLQPPTLYRYCEKLLCFTTAICVRSTLTFDLRM